MCISFGASEECLTLRMPLVILRLFSLLWSITQSVSTRSEIRCCGVILYVSTVCSLILKNGNASKLPYIQTALVD